MSAHIERPHQGHEPFSKSVLAVYDSLVLGAVCHLVWRCPNEKVLDGYRRHLSANHLEVGVGTGYFLDRAVFPVERPRVALLDLNANCLERTAQRIARYAPETYCASVLAPIAIDAPPFDSIALNYVLHCLPGAMPAKAAVFGHLKALLNPGGVIFGATVLSGGVSHTLPAKALLLKLNASGTFSNRDDDLNTLDMALRRHLQDVRIEVVGGVALFAARA